MNVSREVLGNFTPGRSSGCDARCRPSQRSQRHPAVIPIIDQRILRGAIIAQPIMLHQSLLSPRANKRRRRRLPRLRQLVSLYQKQLALSELEEWLRTI